MAIEETIHFKRVWTITRYPSDEHFVKGTPGKCWDPVAEKWLDEVSVFEGNLLLNEGIQLMEDLLIGAGGSAYNNANTYLGVGDSSVAEAATQTGLQAATNKLWKPMQASFPSRATQTVTWQAQFTGTDANYAWAEFTIVNASSDTGTNLNRKVSAQGTKTAGQTWTLSMTLTIS